jgi:hypothetical protein
MIELRLALCTIFFCAGIKGDAVTGEVSVSVLYDTPMYALPICYPIGVAVVLKQTKKDGH